MKVDKLNANVYERQNYSAPAFRNKGLSPDIINHLNRNSNKFAKFLEYVGDNQGEALNILVTAVGTAVVCPLFIAFNPFSKEDEKTKAYSAWRQPISAIIAVVTQLTITKWFNDYMASKASTSNADGTPALSKRADLRAKPHEKYLKPIITREHPEWDKKQVKAEIERRQIAAEKEVVSKYRKLYKDKTIEFKELVCQDYLDKAKDSFFDEFKTNNKEEIEKKFGKKIDDIWSTKLKKHLEKMLDGKAKTLGKEKQVLIQETAERMVEADVISEAVAKYITRFLCSKNASVQKAIDTCTVENTTQLIKDLGLDAKFRDGFDAKEIAENIVKKLEVMREYETANQQKDFTSIKNIGTTFEEILHNVKVKKLVRSRTSDAKRVFKTMNTQMGLVVTLATLPLTCGFLNWAYPRIMEKIMPEMSAKKKEMDKKIEEMNKMIDETFDKNLGELKNRVNVEEIKSQIRNAVLKEGGDD
ncbi:hypothetical protein IKQ21_02735 [bacterium]|nr:hypothetical protein [bacterium]